MVWGRGSPGWTERDGLPGVGAGTAVIAARRRHQNPQDILLQDRGAGGAHLTLGVAAG